MITGYEHAVQISVLFKAVGVGYLIGILFSFFSFLNSISKNSIAVFIRDLLFFIMNAVISFLFLLKYNSGIIRFYILAGESIGFLLFHLFPGSIAEAFIRRIFGNALQRISLKISEAKKKLFTSCNKALRCDMKKNEGKKAKKKGDNDTCSRLSEHKKKKPSKIIIKKHKNK